jgi:toxin YoeB
MTYEIKYMPEALDDIAALKKSDPHAYGKVTKFIKELHEHPRTGTGKPKPMKYRYADCYSRRIDKKNRLVYRINDDKVEVLVLSAIGHYDDK